MQHCPLNWINIVLVEPQIPQNTGNIARLCAATNASLHIIEPCGFILNDKFLKRAGLEYWNIINKKIHRDWDNFLDFISLEQKNLTKGGKSDHHSLLEKRLINNDFEKDLSKRPCLPIRPISTMGISLMYDAQMALGDYMLFGSENTGLSAQILDTWAESSISIPQWGITRSLNLSNSVAVLIYEMARRFLFI